VTFNPCPKPPKVEKVRKGLSPGQGFVRKPGKEYKGLSRGSGFKSKARDVFVDEAGDAHFIGHQDPHGVYRDVDADEVRGGVRAFNPGSVDEHGEPIPAARDKRKSTFKRSKREVPEHKRVLHERRGREGESPDDARYLAACRGEQCYLRVSGICQARGWGSETVVPCHSNQLRHGKAKGLKALDVFTVPGCWACHSWLDQNTTGETRETKFRTWDRAFKAWEPVRKIKLGIMEIPDGVTV
jgi:hypothetical protein